MIRFRFGVFMILALLGPWEARADTPVNEIRKGLEVRVQPVDVPLRSSPQEKFLWFYGVGREIGTMKKCTTLTVKDVQTIRTVLGDQKWIHVSSEGSTGWIYVGTPGDKDSCCIEKLPADPGSCGQ